MFYNFALKLISLSLFLLVSSAWGQTARDLTFKLPCLATYTSGQDFLFEKNQALDLDVNVKNKLKEELEKIKALRISLDHIVIAGHADVGEKNHIPLSLARAATVKVALLEVFGGELHYSKFYLEPRGVRMPFAKAGDAKNRRVEVDILGVPPCR